MQNNLNIACWIFPGFTVKRVLRALNWNYLNNAWYIKVFMLAMYVCRLLYTSKLLRLNVNKEKFLIKKIKKRKYVISAYYAPILIYQYHEHYRISMVFSMCFDTAE